MGHVKQKLTDQGAKPHPTANPTALAGRHSIDQCAQKEYTRGKRLLSKAVTGTSAQRADARPRVVSNT